MKRHMKLPMKLASFSVVRAAVVTLFAAAFSLSAVASGEKPAPLTMVVMDPLAAPLACDCVQGYAQRKYEQLGAYLQQQLARPVKVVWSESLSNAVSENGPAHIVVGKHSVVLFDAKKLQTKMKPVASLTGVDGSTTQAGLLVVRQQDAARSVKDLEGYRIFFGPADCDEKHAAPLALLKKAGLTLPQTLETSPACSTAAAALLELPADEEAAAVISSYAEPLLEGCGTIKKGDLRVVGRSEPVPFITAFVSSKVSEQDRGLIETALLDVELNAELLIALETSRGFQKWKPLSTGASATPTSVKKK